MAKKNKQTSVAGKRHSGGAVGKNKGASIREPDALSEARQRLLQATSAQEIAAAAKQMLHIDPACVDAWRCLAPLQLDAGKSEEALISFSRALRIEPDDEKLLEHYILHALTQEYYFDALCAARHWVDVAKEKPVTATKLLAGLYGLLGKPVLSAEWGLASASIQPLASSDASEKPRLSVLVLGTQDNVPYHYDHSQRQVMINEGHNNLMHMVDRGSISIHSLSVDAAQEQPEVLKQLPEIDVVYNSITDAGRCEEALKKAKKICNKLKLPVINPPQEVLRTTRAENAERLGECEGLLMPKSVSLGRVKGDISQPVREAIANNGMKAPVIVRPSGYQNGRHMYLIDKPESTPVSISDEAEVYVLQYHDVTFTDARAPGHRFHPKYRAFMVGGKLYPAHLRMGHDGDWNVHGEETRKAFRKFPWLYDAEKDFIENPAAHFESDAWENLEKALQILDLDYFGVDFAVCTEEENAGKVVVFETNASMRSFLRQTYQNTPENDAALDIVLAAHRMFCKRAGVSEWDFEPPRGLEGPAQEHDFEADPADPTVTHVLFSGDLQGHGFREWLWHELHKHNLKGWLRNLADGRVEAVVAGSKAAVEHLLKDPKGPEGASIENVDRERWTGAVPQGVRVHETVDEPVGVTTETAEA
ncbi:acylphosphatase [Halospina denitrificans]|uniref:acylphosphatase n=2 Tax=Halospina denitrificans TaxID=332522 RepID=A0A4R7JTB3_9GAMM|nr:acylphosphatase [Halospina denitrificans]